MHRHSHHETLDSSAHHRARTPIGSSSTSEPPQLPSNSLASDRPRSHPITWRASAQRQSSVGTTSSISGIPSERQGSPKSGTAPVKREARLDRPSVGSRSMQGDTLTLRIGAATRDRRLLPDALRSSSRQASLRRTQRSTGQRARRQLYEWILWLRAVPKGRSAAEAFFERTTAPRLAMAAVQVRSRSASQRPRISSPRERAGRKLLERSLLRAPMRHEQVAERRSRFSS